MGHPSKKIINLTYFIFRHYNFNEKQAQIRPDRGVFFGFSGREDSTFNLYN